jgi:hypothetical protein
MRITIRARTLERVHAEAGYMLALGPAFYRLSSCKQGESIYGFRGCFFMISTQVVFIHK